MYGLCNVIRQFWKLLKDIMKLTPPVHYKCRKELNTTKVDCFLTYSIYSCK